MSLYHPIALCIHKAYTGIRGNILRDAFEVKKMQTIYSRTEDFTFKSINKIANKVSGAIMTSFKDCEIVFHTYSKNGEPVIQKTNRENASSRLIITPIDSHINYSRGLVNFASTFVLQQKTESGRYENIFALVFSHCDGQDFTIYSQNSSFGKGVFVNDKMIKINHTTAFAISNLMIDKNFTIACAGNQNLLKVISSVVGLQINDSIGYNILLACNQFADGFIFTNRRAIEILPAYIIMQNLGFTLNLKNEHFEDLLNPSPSLNFTALSKQCFDKVF